MTRDFRPPERAAAALDRRCEIREKLRTWNGLLAAGEDPKRNLASRWNCNMLLGHYEQAWRESDIADPLTITAMQPGTVVLIRCTRGFGDAIQFLRYVPLLKRLGAVLKVQAPPALLPLLAFIGGIDTLIELEYPLKHFSCELELECSDLPYLFRTVLSTIPPETKFSIPAGVTGRFARLESGKRKKIGVAWAAGTWNELRSMPRELLSFWSGIASLEMFSLQREPGHGRTREPLPSGFRSAEGEERDILATAAAILQMDLVISVDTMIAHLAASLGKPVWLLLGYAADWRWMVDRSDTPWYRTIRIFRQPSPDDWLGLAQNVVDALLDFAGVSSATTAERPLSITIEA